MKKLLLTLFFTTYSLSFIRAQTILGIDISNLQGTINWAQAAGSGITFSFAKASEGTNFTDAYFANNMANGESNGLYMGAYHFAHPDVNSTNAGAIAEANYFLSIAQTYIVTCELPPVLDYEVSPSLSWTAQTAWIQNWMNTVQAATGITPVLYTSSSIASNLGSSLYAYPLWIADPDGNPNTPPASTGGWPTWAFKQYSWTGTVAGISGNVDLDVFNGDINAFTSFMGCNAIPSNLAAVIGACPQDSIILQWTGSGSGWYVDISPDSTFSDFYNRAILGLTSIGAPNGFNDYYTGAPLVLMPDSTYYWRVFNGNTETSGGSFTMPAICPVNLQDSADCSSGNVYFSWTNSGSGWYVDVSADSTFATYSNQSVPGLTSIAAPAGFSPAFTFSAGTTYYWRVFNGSTETYGSSFTMPALCPLDLQDSLECSSGNVKFSWTNSGSGWYVDVSADSTFTTYSNQSVPGLTSITAPAGFSPAFTLSAGTTYYWRVWNGSIETSGNSFSCASIAGISEQNNSEAISIYPNPTDGQFFIAANTTGKVTVDLYDITGRHVFSKSVNNRSNIDVSFLYEGVYSLTIKTGDSVINKKLVIVK